MRSPSQVSVGVTLEGYGVKVLGETVPLYQSAEPPPNNPLPVYILFYMNTHREGGKLRSQYVMHAVDDVHPGFPFLKKLFLPPLNARNLVTSIITRALNCHVWVCFPPVP